MKKGADVRETLDKYLVCKRVISVDRKPFIETQDVVVFSGKAEWTPGVNIALSEEMMTACLIDDVLP